ncbi:DUF3857 domain-containing protein [Robertkochia flava]|uniref:DUF3857 domain-containing protein n=1 Tax=Robertkochia flava TaxID=3447986 RepID=UPI001CCC8CCE|nr:DUF3857 domain-containing protein [Robertkochia marina]
MKEYPQDTTANALVLYEKGEAEIRKDQLGRPALFFKKTTRIKILNKNGLTYANVEIPLVKSASDNSREILKEVRAIAINPDRSGGMLDQKDIYYQDVSETVTLVRFTVPNVQTGSVIDYTYEVKSPFLYNFQSWEFQGEIPKLHSEFHTNIPANYKYHIKLNGTLKLDHQNDKIIHNCFYFRGLGTADCVVSEYIMDNIPAFREEEYMTAKPNYLSALRYELTTFENFTGKKEHYTKSWETVEKELRTDDIGRESQKGRYFRNALPEHLMNTPTNLETAQKLFYHLQKQLFWNEKDQLFGEIDVKDAFESREGSSTELNLILLNALHAAGLKAFPVLVSTRDNGVPSQQIPAISDFNALIVKLDLEERSYLLDLSEKEFTFGMIRFEMLNQYGRLLDFKDGGSWIPLLQPEAYSRQIFQASLDPGAGKARVRKISSGYYASEKRKEIRNTSEGTYLADIEKMLEARGDFSLTHYENQGLPSSDERLTESFEIDMNTDVKEDRLFVNPFILESYKKSPFTQQSRTYPVDFGHPFNIEYTIFIETGDEFMLEDKAADLHLELPDSSGELIYNIRELDENVMVVLQMKIYKPIIPPTQYAALKEFFNEFVRLQNKNPITLVKLSKFISENAGKK